MPVDHLLPRRAVLLAGLGGVSVAAAGCNLLESTPSGPASPAEPAVEADSERAEALGRDIAQALALVTATGGRFRRLAPVCDQFGVLHRAHGNQLNVALSAPVPVVAATRAAARAELFQAEADLQNRIVTATLAAESGALARLFASMAAGLAQHRVALA